LRSKLNSGISEKGGKRVLPEIRIKLSDNQDFIDSLIDNEKLDFGEKYKLNRR